MNNVSVPVSNKTFPEEIMKTLKDISSADPGTTSSIPCGDATNMTLGAGKVLFRDVVSCQRAINERCSKTSGVHP